MIAYESWSCRNVIGAGEQLFNASFSAFFSFGWRYLLIFFVNHKTNCYWILFFPDSDLLFITKFCIYLQHVNVNGCTALTDVGLSALIHRRVRLRSILVCHTSFGLNSVLALCSRSHHKKDSSAHSSESMSLNLLTLHIGGCKCKYHLLCYSCCLSNKTYQLLLKQWDRIINQSLSLSLQLLMNHLSSSFCLEHKCWRAFAWGTLTSLTGHCIVLLVPPWRCLMFLILWLDPVHTLDKFYLSLSFSSRIGSITSSLLIFMWAVTWSSVLTHISFQISASSIRQ